MNPNIQTSTKPSKTFKPHDLCLLKTLLPFLLIILWVTPNLAGCQSSSASNPEIPTLSIKPEGHKVFDEDGSFFTQGFAFKADTFIESAGQYGSSRIRLRNAKTNSITKTVSLPKDTFAEGVTSIDNRIYLASWKSEKLRDYDQNLNLINIREFPGEHWGLCSDGVSLIESNGSQTLTYYDPKTLAKSKEIQVRLDDKKFLTNLNELEYIDNFIWANVWQTPWIAIINPKDGQVVKLLDCSNFQEYEDLERVCNGIAYDSTNRVVWVTGKYWKNRYQIALPQ